MTGKAYAFVNDTLYVGLDAKSKLYKKSGTVTATSLRYPSLGFLPPCVRFMSPYFSIGAVNEAIVIVENVPRAFNGVALGWHSFICTVNVLSAVINVQLVFSDTQIQGPDTKLYIPYLPNVFMDKDTTGYNKDFGSIVGSIPQSFLSFYNQTRDELLIRCMETDSGVCWDKWKDTTGVDPLKAGYTITDVASKHFFEDSGVPSIELDDIITHVKSKLNSEVLLK